MIIMKKVYNTLKKKCAVDRFLFDLNYSNFSERLISCKSNSFRGGREKKKKSREMAATKTRKMKSSPLSTSRREGEIAARERERRHMRRKRRRKKKLWSSNGGSHRWLGATTGRSTGVCGGQSHRVNGVQMLQRAFFLHRPSPLGAQLTDAITQLPHLTVH